MGVSGSAVILTAFRNVSCGHNGLAAAFYAFRLSGFLLFKSVEIRNIRLIRVLFRFTNNFYMRPILSA